MMFVSLIFIFLVHQINANCRLEPSIKGGDGGIGIIFVPGAKISGSAYLPLLRRVQEFYPRPMWIAATTEWLGDMPNPIEIGSQIADCLVQAKAKGLDTSNVFFGGHSLGGIVLENYISGHAELAKGIFLLGTWLPDLLRGSNEFPVPVLTAIGELDGGGLSYLRREWEETNLLDRETRKLTKTIVVPQVNHGQVASGVVPQSVVDNDIDPELSEEDAHRNYGIRVSDWLLLNTDLNDAAIEHFARYEDETTTFLQPFLQMRDLEQGGSFSEFSVISQELLLEVALSDMLEINNEILDTISFPLQQPYLEKNPQTGTVKIKTLTHLNYDLDILDFNNHLSASTMKIKMKSADSIYDALNLPTNNFFLPCKELNKYALDLAMQAASPSAMKRMTEKGRRLEFLEDDEFFFGGIQWEVAGSLTWTEDENRIVSLQSSLLKSDLNFPLFAGVHYCDVLSPYRALEWIYIESLRHVMHF